MKSNSSSQLVRTDIFDTKTSHDEENNRHRIVEVQEKLNSHWKSWKELYFTEVLNLALEHLDHLNRCFFIVQNHFQKRPPGKLSEHSVNPTILYEKINHYYTWKINGVVADEKFKLLVMCFSGLYFDIKPLIVTVFAVPCSPISRTA